MVLYAPDFLEAVTGDTAFSYHGQDFRRMISALNPNQGVILAGDLLISPRAAGANMSIDVAAGRAFVAGGSIARQGTYIVESDAVVNVAIAAADPTNPRWDTIVAQVYDKQADGGTRYSWTPLAVTGTPAPVGTGTPAAPAVPTNALLLGYVYVNPNITSVPASALTDSRTLCGKGDVPKWDMSNTQATAQSIPNNAGTIYTPQTRFQVVGVTADATLAKVTIRTPGRYVVHYSARLAASTASGPRTANIALYDTNGTTLLRNIANTVVSSNRDPISSAGTVYMSAGQQIQANLYQNTGQALSIDDTFLDNNFTGVWVGA